jgi:hypothetical protein
MRGGVRHLPISIVTQTQPDVIPRTANHIRRRKRSRGRGDVRHTEQTRRCLGAGSEDGHGARPEAWRVMYTGPGPPPASGTGSPPTPTAGRSAWPYLPWPRGRSPGSCRASPTGASGGRSRTVVSSSAPPEPPPAAGAAEPPPPRALNACRRRRDAPMRPETLDDARADPGPVERGAPPRYVRRLVVTGSKRWRRATSTRRRT